MAHRSIRTALALLSAAVLAATAAGCTEQVQSFSPSQPGDPVQLVNPGQLTTCTSLPYKPFQFTRDGEVVGFDVDLIDLVAEELGVPQKIVSVSFEGIKSGESLNIGECDLAAAAITITPSRKEVMDFSNPYFAATQSLLVRKSSGIDGLEDLRGKRLGVQRATTGHKYAKEHQDEYGYEIVQFEDIALQQTAVLTGQVAAAINDDEPNEAFVEDHPKMAVTKSFETGEHYGFAVRTGNGALRGLINKVLEQAKSDGTYARLYEKWFGTPPPDSATS